MEKVKQFFGKNSLRGFLAIFWSIIAASYIFSITFLDIPEKNVQHANTITGFLLGTVIGTIITYYLGSSQGSADKNELIKSNLKEE